MKSLIIATHFDETELKRKRSRSGVRAMRASTPRSLEASRHDIGAQENNPAG